MNLSGRRVMPCGAGWFLVRTVWTDMMNSNLDSQDSIHRAKVLKDRSSRFAWKPWLSLPVHSRSVDGSETALCACSSAESSNARVVESLMVPISFN